MFEAIKRRSPRLGAFLENRLTPGVFLGLHLTMGALVTLAAGWAFGAIAEDVVTSESIVILDQTVARWCNAHATPSVVTVAKVFTFLGSGAWLTALAAGVAVWLWRTRRWHRLLTLVLTVGGGNGLNVALKHVFQRDRPVVEHPLVHLSTYSFPSGHTIGATLFYGLWVFFLAQDVGPGNRRRGIAATGMALILLVALSRVVLGAHYVSDVLGAFCVGVMWIAACITGVELNRRYHQRHVSPTR